MRAGPPWRSRRDRGGSSRVELRQFMRGLDLSAAPGWLLFREMGSATGRRRPRGPRDRARSRGRWQRCFVCARTHSARVRGALEVRPAGERGATFPARHRHVERARLLSGDPRHESWNAAPSLAQHEIGGHWGFQEIQDLAADGAGEINKRIFVVGASDLLSWRRTYPFAMGRSLWP